MSAPIPRVRTANRYLAAAGPQAHGQGGRHVAILTRPTPLRRKAAELVARHRIDPASGGRALATDDNLAVREILLGRAPTCGPALSLLIAVARSTTPGWCSDHAVGHVAYVAGHSSRSRCRRADVPLASRPGGRTDGLAATCDPAATQRFRRSFLFGYADRMSVLLADSRRDAEAPPVASDGRSGRDRTQLATASSGAAGSTRSLESFGAVRTRAGPRDGRPHGLGSRLPRPRTGPTSAGRGSPAGGRSARAELVDADRSAVYAAELAAFDGTDLEAVVDFDEPRARMRSVTTGEWWPGPPVECRRAARRRALVECPLQRVGRAAGTRGDPSGRSADDRGNSRSRARPCSGRPDARSRPGVPSGPISM